MSNINIVSSHKLFLRADAEVNISATRFCCIHTSLVEFVILCSLFILSLVLELRKDNDHPLIFVFSGSITVHACTFSI